MTSPKTRQRSGMEPGDFAQLMRPYIKSPVFSRCPEKLGDPVKVDLLVAHRRMIKTLWNAQENLSFTQGLVVAGLAQ
eukprot:13393485-Alexandrium_andersonii.AAC.1